MDTPYEATVNFDQLDMDIVAQDEFLIKHLDEAVKAARSRGGKSTSSKSKGDGSSMLRTKTSLLGRRGAAVIDLVGSPSVSTALT